MLQDMSERLCTFSFHPLKPSPFDSTISPLSPCFRSAVPAVWRWDPSGAHHSRAEQPGHTARSHRAHVPSEVDGRYAEVTQHGHLDQGRGTQCLLRAGGRPRHPRPQHHQDLPQRAHLCFLPCCCTPGKRRPEGEEKGGEEGKLCYFRERTLSDFWQLSCQPHYYHYIK